MRLCCIAAPNTVSAPLRSRETLCLRLQDTNYGFRRIAVAITSSPSPTHCICPLRLQQVTILSSNREVVIYLYTQDLA
jgi:hypothetical protein